MVYLFGFYGWNVDLNQFDCIGKMIPRNKLLMLYIYLYRYLKELKGHRKFQTGTTWKLRNKERIQMKHINWDISTGISQHWRHIW